MRSKSYKSDRKRNNFDGGFKFSISIEGTAEPLFNKPDCMDNESLRYKMQKGMISKEDYDRITIHNPF